MFNWDKFGIDVSKVRGGKTFCPKCHYTRKNKGDRSLSVNTQTGMFKCHNAGDCDFKGNASLDVLMHREKEVRQYRKPLPKLQSVSDKTLKYFEGRGISNNTLLQFKITESSEYMPGGKGHEAGQYKAICFNYYRGEELVNIKYRSAFKSFKMEKDAELIFYNLNALHRFDEIVIVEGEIDALTLWECGISNVVSVPNGASTGNNTLVYLDNCWQDFEQVTKIIVATDEDGPGAALKRELIRRLGAERCFEVVYPDGVKDANELLLKYGKDAVKELIATATEIPLPGIAKAVDYQSEMRNIYKYGFTPPMPVYWGLDEYIKWTGGDLTIVTGTPGSGKSTWLNNLLERLARIHHWPIAMYTPEKEPITRLLYELSCIHIGEPYYHTDAAKKMTTQQATDAMNFINDHFLFLKHDELEDRSIHGILTVAKECVKRWGIKALVIDPWNYLEMDLPKGASETNYISEVLSLITGFCKKYDVHTFVVAHPTKMGTEGTGASKKLVVPNLYSISGSAHFYNKTDNGIVVYRNHELNCTDIYIQKVRWDILGFKIGQAQMFYEAKSKRFYDSPPENGSVDRPDNPAAGIGNRQLMFNGFQPEHEPPNQNYFDDDTPF